MLSRQRHPRPKPRHTRYVCIVALPLVILLYASSTLFRQSPLPLADQGHRPHSQGGVVVADDKPAVFLFLGILSALPYQERRAGVREAWSNAAQSMPTSICRFIMSSDERTSEVDQELATYHDIIFVDQPTNYTTILIKTFFVFQYAVWNYRANFVLKTDDDAYVNVPATISMLRGLCTNAQCSNQRLYIGTMARGGVVHMDPEHRWSNVQFFNHTGLEKYPNYMMGGGYIISGDVAAALVSLHDQVGLKFTPIEDATFGFWLSAMDLRHIDHPKIYAWGTPCCLRRLLRRKDANGDMRRLRLLVQPWFRKDLCSDEPWLILHKIDTSEKMRVMADAIKECVQDRQAKVQQAQGG